MTTMSKTVQRAVVGEGLGAGLLALGIQEFNPSKGDLEFALRHAWKAWPYAPVFPQVRADVSRDDLVGIINDSPGQRSGPQQIRWTRSWPFRIESSWGWTPDDVGEHTQELYGVGLAGWVQLASPFAEGLGLLD
ncbi:hypothetical protein [Quadrisphaera sp. INWT6]|uniref:hypothetical protein n=1 Tax=Quadrisphaera sp. INWT6 TaxID=2596917 RepID=UPI0018927AA9|nr:hypothetical protein [Quadrisphaera sp. INWT6]MBF5080770.1 hypothetical protein [Quadrisphaera sp. INWT6]